MFDLAAFTEAVTHHALGKQEKDNCHTDDQEALPDSEQRQLSFFMARRFGINCHWTFLSCILCGCH
jgi:hypothetical protein